ncbi:hypothetical protein HETIRDRAFT_327793 [Heterobasidion irregulare TC 32-1]|uniref:Uncharacterized protein n=1 Tax=Heterobasidion irregulare (strain TC 32-1) TaxID=747525 RepID=W4JU31_HETIT|nr:uncharacterized protein HETIRDRAFT_327793 [Heterobasidion irregulare TC 32-1]ETW77063.1 hypothetical protein HETIRDRAFT_327793 [Heterobasidion irregulare TC 32-1]
MPHGCHLWDSLITRLYSWERPYSGSQSGYIAFFLHLDCLTLFSPCLTLFQLFHRVSRLRRSCVISLTLRTDLQVELLSAFLNTCGPRAILSSDSYSLDHSLVIIELLFGTLSVPVTLLSLRSTSAGGTTTGARGGGGAGSATG